jgi:hypothetical protein
MSNPYRDCLAKLANKIDFTWGDIPADVEDLLCRAHTLLDQPPEPSGYDEPARFAAWLRKHSSDCMELGRPDWAHMSSRAAELLEQHLTPPRKPQFPAPRQIREDFL